MKISLSSILIILAIFGYQALAQAEERNRPHVLKPGQVISADVLNEAFERLEKSSDGFNSTTELVGTWMCTMTSINTDCALFDRYSLHASGLYYTASQSVVIKDDGDGTFSYTSEFWLRGCYNDGNASQWQNTQTADLALAGQFLVSGPDTSIVNQGGDAKTILELNRISDIQFDMRPISGGDTLMTCVKQNLPPDSPDSLTAEQVSQSVALTWVDNSSDETGFEVLRKTTATGEWSVIATTAADSTNFSDTPTAAGVYWYRVKALNQNGASLGTNVVKITLGE